MTRVGVVVPIRAFALGKARLADRLHGAEREALARRMAEQVVGAAGALPVLVVSSDDQVRVWAEERSCTTLEDPGSLDGAAGAGATWFAAAGYGRIVVAHADLPRADSFGRVIRDGGQAIVTVVPCHRDDGTPVLSLPTGTGFRFQYGPGSFRRHAAEARRLGLGVRVVRDANLAFDVDTAADLDALSNRR